MAAPHADAWLMWETMGANPTKAQLDDVRKRFGDIAWRTRRGRDDNLRGVFGA